MTRKLNLKQYIPTILMQFILGVIMLLVYFRQSNSFYLVCAILIIVSTILDVYNKIIDRTKPTLQTYNVALKKLLYNQRAFIEGLIMCLIGFLIFEIWVYASGYKYLFVLLAIPIAGRLLLTKIQLKRLRLRLKEEDKKND